MRWIKTIEENASENANICNHQMFILLTETLLDRTHKKVKNEIKLNVNSSKMDILGIIKFL